MKRKRKPNFCGFLYSLSLSHFLCLLNFKEKKDFFFWVKRGNKTPKQTHRFCLLNSIMKAGTCNHNLCVCDIKTDVKKDNKQESLFISFSFLRFLSLGSFLVFVITRFIFKLYQLRDC